MSEDGSARPEGGAEQFGILIYTATAGAQGNARLRGRVSTGSRKASRAPHGRLGLVVGTRDRSSRLPRVQERQFAPQDDALGGIARDGKGGGCRGVSPMSVGRPLEPP